MTERAHGLLREQLANDPKPRALIEAGAEAADIPERALISATDPLGVRTQGRAVVAAELNHQGNLFDAGSWHRRASR